MGGLRAIIGSHNSNFLHFCGLLGQAKQDRPIFMNQTTTSRKIIFSPLITFLSPQYFDFTLDQKLRNVFNKVFLVQIRQKIREIHSKVCVQGKKISEKRVPN
jgi:hypothetical protein